MTMQPTVGTAGGNKDLSSITIGTAAGNKTVSEGWVGTSAGNKQFYNSFSVALAPTGWNFDGVSEWDASVTTTITGGTAPFSYSWSWAPVGEAIARGPTNLSSVALASVNNPPDSDIVVYLDVTDANGLVASANTGPLVINP